MSDKHRKFIGFVLYWGIVLVLCWVGVRYVLLWLLPFLIALGLAYLMEPSVCFLREKLRLRRGFVSAVLSLLLLALLLAVLTVLCLNLLQCSAPVSVLVATLPLTALARAFAIRHKAPLTVFLLSGIFPLVPGAGIYNSAYYFLQDDRALFANAGVETLKIALMLALGIALVCSVPLPQNHSTQK